MATDLRNAAYLAVILVVIGFVSKGRAFIGHHGLFTIMFRHLTGHTLTGEHLTDAGWFTAATDKAAKTNTGRTRRFWYRPRAHRMARRDIRYSAIVLLLAVWKDWPFWAACLITITAIGSVAGWQGRRGWAWWAARKHRRTWYEPAHRLAAPLVGIPKALPASSWLQIEPDRSRMRADLPPDYNPDVKDKERLVTTFATVLGLESPQPKWQLTGPEHWLELVRSSPPPAEVLLADVRGELDRIKSDELVWGIGKHNTLITTSLSGDSPHIGLSIGSGGGKSRAARSLLAQMLYRGALGVVLDVKQVSQHWAAWSGQLPNVIFARTPAEIHHVLLWLLCEMTRRNAEALKHADVEGNAPRGIVGPRIIIVGEELNATAKALRAYWRETREKDQPTRSPALNALDALSFMGRQADMNVVFIGQRLSVAASGGDGDSRENIGTIALGRYSPSNWRMMAPDFAMPPKSMTPGRLQIVTDKVQEVQGINMTGLEARQLAMAGLVESFPPDAPGGRPVIAGRVEAVGGPEQHHVTVTSPVHPGLPPGGVTGLVTLSEAVGQGIVGRTVYAMRIARYRGQLPAHVREQGGAYLYDAEELRAWDLRGR